MIEIRKLGSRSIFSQEQSVELSVNSRSNEFIMNSLMPRYWKISQKPGVKLHADPDRRQIFIPERYFNNPGNTFSLLHEIGHANSDSSKSEAELEEESVLRDKLTYEGVDSFTENEKRIFRATVYLEEKNAWDFALSTYRGLKESGINLEPAMSEETLTNMAMQKLASYDI